MAAGTASEKQLEGCTAKTLAEGRSIAYKAREANSIQMKCCGCKKDPHCNEEGIEGKRHIYMDENGKKIQCGYFRVPLN